jgi:hypothetical protein
MRVSEPHAVAREAVNVRRLYLRRAVASDIVVAEIIREDDDNVRIAWFTISGVQRGLRRQQQDGEEGEGLFHLAICFTGFLPAFFLLSAGPGQGLAGSMRS